MAKPRADALPGFCGPLGLFPRAVLVLRTPLARVGAGLALGKERTQALIESFGGRVTTCLSGVTDVLLVGKEVCCRGSNSDPSHPP